MNYMKAIWIFTCMIIVFGVGVAKSQKIYSTNVESRADVKVYVENVESRPDLVVYKTKVASRAKKEDNKGIWFFEEVESRADKTIFFEDVESRADLKIFFTDVESRAGWRNSSKKYLLY